MAESTLTTASVRIAALGGLGEIGLNLMVIECAGRAIIIDCGVMFPDEPALGMGTYVPDLTWLERGQFAIDAIVLTHAHEDHIGALPHLLRRFRAPVYGTQVTLAFARRRLVEAEFRDSTDLREMVPRRTFEAGPFTIEPIAVTHSTPESVALAIRTPAGIIVHSGDFKIDDAPVDGQKFDRERFAELGREGVALLLSDSTNVERPGRSGSESSIKPVLRELTSRTRGRFFLSAFSSHLHRIRQAVEVSREFGRMVVPLGRRMAESVRLGREIGQLQFGPGVFAEPEEAEFIEPRKLSFLASGSQGEPLSALAKLATDSHPHVHIEAGDVVTLSSRFIPGNERTINRLVNRLYKQGADVVYDAVAPVHVSGHASQDELAELITLTRPRWFVPIHGEYRHLSRHVALAIAAGVDACDCFLLEDGGSLIMNANGARRGNSVPAGRVILEGAEAGDPAVVDERRALARDGTVTAIVVLSAKSGKIIAGPDLVSRGLVTGDGTSVHMQRAREELIRRLRAMNGCLGANEPEVKDAIVRSVRRYFSDELGKRPIVIPYVTEV
ncbi:MAG TPA: ribonuclease J [Candidatus Binataceae bacterium]|nr:ribonuclease J [Candidatus Binataceae bacterium]